MSWTDNEIDELFRSTAKEEQTVNYKSDYWSEMEKLLPEKKSGKDLLWIMTSILFTVVLFTAFWRPQDHKTSAISIASNQKNSDYVKEEENDKLSEEISPVKEEEQQIERNTLIFSIDDDLLKMQSYQMPDYGFYSKPHDQMLQLDSPANEKESGMVNELPTMDIYSNSNTQKTLLSLQEKAIMPSTGHAFYFQSVVGASQSLITPSENISGSYGIGAGYALRRGNFVFNSGVNMMISNHSDLYLTRTAKVYGFGSSVYTYNFNYRQLFELEGLIEAGYQHNRSEFKIGIRPSYLMSSRVVINSKGEGLNLSDESTQDKQVYSFTGGLKRFGLKPTLGYAYHLKPDLELGINAGVQVIKRIDEEYVLGDSRRFAVDAQIYLRKNISWQKK